MHHFQESGLSYVWLKNGFLKESLKDYGNVISYTDAIKLERAIVINLIQHCSLSGFEMRFIRSHMGWTVKRMAKKLGLSIKEVELYEMSDDPIEPEVIEDIRKQFATILDLQSESFTPPVQPSRIHCELIDGQWRCDLDFTQDLMTQ